jgi:hypothetical protein
LPALPQSLASLETGIKNKAQVLTIVLSALTTLLVAFLGYYGNRSLEEIRKDSAEVAQTKTLELEREKLRAEQQARLEKNLLDYVPKLVGSDEAARKAATAVLFILYPNDAKSYIDRVAASLGEEEKKAFQPAIKQAEGLAERTGSWTIVIGSDSSLEAAQDEANKAAKQGYTPAVIYKKGKWFVTTVGSYPSQDVANNENVAIRSKIRSSAFSVNVNSWCNTPVDKNGYYECAS